MENNKKLIVILFWLPSWPTLLIGKIYVQQNNGALKVFNCWLIHLIIY